MSKHRPSKVFEQVSLAITKATKTSPHNADNEYEFENVWIGPQGVAASINESNGGITTIISLSFYCTKRETINRDQVSKFVRRILSCVQEFLKGNTKAKIQIIAGKVISVNKVSTTEIDILAQHVINYAIQYT